MCGSPYRAFFVRTYLIIFYFIEQFFTSHLILGEDDFFQIFDSFKLKTKKKNIINGGNGKYKIFLEVFWIFNTTAKFLDYRIHGSMQ